MLRTLPVTDDQTWLNKLRPEFRDSINHPRDPENTTPTNNPTTSANTSEDRGDVGTISQGYHRTRVGRTLLTAADSHFLALGCLVRFLEKSKNRVGRTLRKRRP